MSTRNSRRHPKDPNAILIWAGVALVLVALARLLSWLFGARSTQ